CWKDRMAGFRMVPSRISMARRTLGRERPRRCPDDRCHGGHGPEGTRDAGAGNAARGLAAMRRAAVPSKTDGPDPFALTHDQRYHGVRVVASAANDADDCALLLAMLGLDPRRRSRSLQRLRVAAATMPRRATAGREPARWAHGE